MKYVKIFLASSVVEFEKERRELGDYIRSLNDIYVKRGIYFELNLCEDLSNAIDKERKQEQYNRIIRDSQYFYILFGNHAGEYTIEEFDVAWEQFRSSGEPKLYTYFMQLPDGQPAEKTVQDFMSRLDKEIGHYYSMFSHLDSVKLNMLIELTRDPTLHSTVKFEGGQATLDGEPILSLENVPLYSKNETIQRLVAEMGRLEEEYDHIAADCRKNPEDNSLKLRRLQVSQQIGQVSEQLRQLEDDLLSVYETVTKKLPNKHISYWEKEALHLVDEGDYEGAKAILRDHKREEELQTALRMAERGKEGIWQYISGKRTLIVTLKATALNQESIQEITSIYEEIIKLAEEYRIELGVLYEYADFLNDQQLYSQGIDMAERLKLYYQLDKSISDNKRVQLFKLLGSLYLGNSNFKQAEESFLAALKILKDLRHMDRYTWEPKTATLFSDLGTVYLKTGYIKKAAMFYKKALEIHSRLTEISSEEYELNISLDYNNLGNCLGENLNRMDEAKDFLLKALAISQHLARMKPDRYISHLATVCNNLGNIFQKAGQMNDAKKYYLLAIDSYCLLAQSNPIRYEPDLALVYYNLAGLLQRIDHMDNVQDIVEFYRKSISLYQNLAEINDSYRSVLSNAYNNFGDFLFQCDLKEEAKCFYVKALEIRKELVKSNATVYEFDLASSYFNLAALEHQLGQNKIASLLYNKSLDIFLHMEETHIKSYAPFIAKIYDDLAELSKKDGKHDEAADYYNKSLKIYLHLEQESPSIFAFKIAANYHDLAVLYYETNQSEKAKAYYLKALEKYQELAQQDSIKYSPYLALCYENCGIFLFNISHDEHASKSFFQEALSIYEKYPHLAARAQQVRDILVKHFEV